MHIYLWSTLCFETKIARIYPVRYRLRLSHRVNEDFFSQLCVPSKAGSPTSASSGLKASFRHRDSLSATGSFYNDLFVKLTKNWFFIDRIAWICLATKKHKRM